MYENYKINIPVYTITHANYIRNLRSSADRNKNDVNETGKSLNPINCRYNVDDLNEMSNERMYQLRMSKSSGNLLSTLKNGNGSSQNTKSKSSIRQNYPASTSKSVQFRLQKAKSNECVLPFNQVNYYFLFHL